MPGQKLLGKAKQTGNKVAIPTTRRLGLADFVALVFQQASKDNLAAFAGYLVYTAVFTVFPFFTLLLSILGLLNQDNLVNTLAGYVGQFMPRQAASYFTQTIFGYAKTHASGAFTIGAVISSVIALWGVSGGFRAIMTAMNVMYDVEDTRPFWKRYLISILLALGSVLSLIVSLGLLVFGSQLGEKLASVIGLGRQFTQGWNIARWPVLVFLVLLAFALIYHFAPDMKQAFHLVSTGNVSAVILWLVFSLLFSIYVNNFGNYNNTYGAFAGIALLLLYLYYSSYILLLGAEMNRVIFDHSKNRPPKVQDSGATAP